MEEKTEHGVREVIEHIHLLRACECRSSFDVSIGSMQSTSCRLGPGESVNEKDIIIYFNYCTRSGELICKPCGICNSCRE